MRDSDPRARSLGLFAPRLKDGYLAFGGFYGNVISASDLRDEDPDNEDVKRLLRGVNKGWIEWDQASEELWKLWFKHLSDRGVTALRIFPRRKDNGDVLDLCGKINQPLLELMERFFAAAEPFGIHFLLIVIPEPTRTGYLSRKHLKQWVQPAYPKSELKNLPAQQRRFVVQGQTTTLTEFFTDPDVWFCQRLYLDALLPWIKKQPQVFALEISNEEGWWKQQFHWEIEEAVEAWSSRVVDYIHKHLPRMPVCISHPGFGILGYEPLRWCRETPIDFYSPHLYCGIDGSRRGLDFGLVTDLVTNYCSAITPAFLGEWGVFGRKVDSRVRQLALRDAIWFSVLNGSPGLFQWVNSSRYAFEYKKAREILEPLRLDEKPRLRPLVGIDVTETAHTLDSKGLYQNHKRDPWRLAGSKAQGETYLDLLRCTELFLNHGVAFDYTLTPQQYEISSTPGHAKEIYVPPEKSLFAFSPEYQCKYAAFGDWEVIIAYFRNVAPVVAEGFNLRSQAERPFQVLWQLPKRPSDAKGAPWRYRLTIHNLDTGEVRQSRVPRESSADFGNSCPHDFAFVFER